VLDMVIGVHAAPPEVRRIAWPDQFVVPQLDQVLAALDGRGDGDGSGPYGRAAAELVTRHAGAIRRMLDQYDDLVRRARADPERAVLTHGEPHRANTMRTGDGWVLIDWETARVAPPERDLWALDPGDGSVLAAYAAATGVVPRPEILRLYRLRWQVADLAIDLARFRRPHTGSEDDAASWRILTEIIEALAGGSPER
jgi:spectinomycin phosphotransferase/16S rRNA (guanine(1405)-N(7))-methyltransferase